MNKNTIDSILKYLILAGIFLIPFVFLIAPSDSTVTNPSPIIFFANNFFFPFITSKGFVFRIIVEVIFVLWAALMLRDKKYLPRFSWMSMTITVFTLAILVSDLVGMNPLRSLWSNFERMEGWMMIIHIWAYFIVLSSMFTNRKNWQQLFNVNLFAGLVVGIYGICQLTGVAQIHQGSTRLDASLGNAEYLAVYMLFQTFLAAYLFFVSWLKEREAKRIIKMIFYGISSLFFAYILYETATRGAILGIIGGIMVALLVYAVWGKKDIHHQGHAHNDPHSASHARTIKRGRIISGTIIVVIILGGILFYANKNAPFIQKNEVLQRMASISWQDTQSQARIYIWPMALKGAFQNPKTALLGWGQENFNYIFNSDYNPLMWHQEQWFDRAHSVILDWLVAGGLIGLILYLSLFVFAIISIVKSDLRVSHKAIFLGLLAAYGIHIIFVFDNLASYVLFATILAFATTLTDKQPYSWFEKKINLHSENFVVVRDYALMPVFLIILILTVYFINVRPIQANLRLVDGLRACSNGDIAATADFASALSLDKYVANQEIREQLLSCATNVINSSNVADQAKSDIYTLSLKAIADQIKATPQDARIYTLAGSFYNQIGDPASAQPLLEKAHELSPAKQSIDAELAADYMNEGSTTAAVALMQKAYESATDDGDSQIGYAAALILDGQEAKAQQLFGNIPGFFADQRIINVYMKLKEYSKATALYKQLIAANPDDTQNYLALTAAYLQENDLYDAGQELKIVETNFPQSKAQVDPVLKEIEAGKNPLPPQA